MSADDVIRAARGIPAHVVILELNRRTPGVNWRGCGKVSAIRDAMRVGYLYRGAILNDENARSLVERLGAIRELMAEGYKAGEASRELDWRARQKKQGAR